MIAPALVERSGDVVPVPDDDFFVLAGGSDLEAIRRVRDSAAFLEEALDLLRFDAEVELLHEPLRRVRGQRGDEGEVEGVVARAVGAEVALCLLHVYEGARQGAEAVHDAAP